jgi:hypothetical protein
MVSGIIQIEDELSLNLDTMKIKARDDEVSKLIMRVN